MFWIISNSSFRLKYDDDPLSDEKIGIVLMQICEVKIPTHLIMLIFEISYRYLCFVILTNLVAGSEAH